MIEFTVTFGDGNTVTIQVPDSKDWTEIWTLAAIKANRRGTHGTIPVKIERA